MFLLQVHGMTILYRFQVYLLPEGCFFLLDLEGLWFERLWLELKGRWLELWDLCVLGDTRHGQV